MSTIHTFLPIVTVTEREDGRLNVEIDWSDSQDEARDSETGNELDGHNLPGQPGHAVAAALDAWIKTQPATFIIAGNVDQS